MAASSKVNPSVEQSNVSSGWDEARIEVSAHPLILEVEKKPLPGPRAPGSGAANFEDRWKVLHSRVRDYLAWGKHECQRIAKTVGRQMRWVKEEHPGYIVGAAAAAGFACGLALRRTRVRKEMNRYD